MVTFGIVLAWVLIPTRKPQPCNISVPPCTEKQVHPRLTASPDNSNMLHMFGNSIYNDFRTAYKHVSNRSKVST